MIQVTIWFIVCSIHCIKFIEMKILLIVLGLSVLTFIAFQAYSMMSRQNIESYPYQVVKIHEVFEVRAYEASLFTSVKLATNDYKKASRSGFSVLAGYIFGGNQKNQKIAMTSPVALSLEDSMTMMFMVPKKYTKDDLPLPNTPNIQFIEEPAKTVAALTFGGWASTDKLNAYRQKLETALAKEGIGHTGQFYYLGYNPPFDLINRKNEVIVELK